MRSRTWLFCLTLLLLLVACREDEATPTPPADIPTRVPAAVADPELVPEEAAAPEGQLLISELVIGLQGNNNYEFVELYNSGETAVDLRGYSLMYQFPGRDEVRLFRWTTRSDIPSRGHFLLVRAGEDVGVLPDAQFEEQLLSQGRLTLLDPDGNVLDEIAFGEDAAELVEQPPATAPERGESIERLPGGIDGNGTDTGRSADDFVVRSTPSPQNSGDAPTPLLSGGLSIDLTSPETVLPGDTFTVDVEVTNLTGAPVVGALVYLPLFSELEALALPNGATNSNNRIEWAIAELDDGDTVTGSLTLAAPFNYYDIIWRGYFAEADGLRYYGALQPLNIGGGTIPVVNARGLTGSTVIVEGVATMYTGGFFAGSTGNKFYLEDDSGGIQVYCPDGIGNVDVNVGDVVRVTGYIELYRTSLELIPCDEAFEVEVVGQVDAPAPTQVDVVTAATDPTVLGELNQVNGIVTRLEEFNFSYEIDLTDADGNSLLVYIDKLTEINVEAIEVGQEYEVTGISESWDGNVRLMPRLQADLARVFPPVLLIELTAPFSAPAGSTITYTLTATNYTPERLEDVTLITGVPTGDIAPATLADDDVNWSLGTLEAEGGSATISYSFTISPTASGTVEIPAIVAGNQAVETVVPETAVVYIGNGVPIWALQGDDMSSSYARRVVATEGVVTGVFPDLNGFFIQDVDGDGDPTTSDGIFVSTNDLDIAVSQLDVVAVLGTVRELSGQTTLDVTAVTDVVVFDRESFLPAPIELNPPANPLESELYYEAVEGMLVSVTTEARAVAPTSQFGEYAVVLAEANQSRIMRGEETGLLIFVDDGSTVRHEDQSTLPYTVYTGDVVSGLIGPLAYTFGNYKIVPITNPIVTPIQQALPAPLILGPNQFSIATYNVENLFDDQLPHFDDDRPSGDEYALKLAKTADAILLMGVPTIVALQEVENIGVLEELVAEPALASFNYVPVLIEGDDSRGIDVAYLVRGDQATVESFEAFPAPEGVTSRHPLLLQVTVELPAGSTTLYLLNNHFTSLAGGEEATLPRRLAQAEWNIALVEQIRADDPTAFIVVLGDLNSYYDSVPVNALVNDGGLVHVYTNRESENLYSYIFEGESETLDHILVDPFLFEYLLDVQAVHINADFPPPIPNDPSAQRASDHDPIVAIFVLP